MLDISFSAFFFRRNNFYETISFDSVLKSRHPVGERGPGFQQRPGNTGWRYNPRESGPEGQKKGGICLFRTLRFHQFSSFGNEGMKERSKDVPVRRAVKNNT
jgi:hypothetical protein